MAPPQSQTVELGGIVIIPVMAEKEMSAQQDKPAEVLNGKPNASRRVSFSRSAAEFDLSRKMAPFLDIHLLLPVFDWRSQRYPFSLDSSVAALDAKMYKQNEIAKARFALLQKTNMLEYALDVFKTIYGDEEPPKGSLSRGA